MFNTCVLIFPHQLFENSPINLKNKKVFLIEDSLFFGDIRYKLKFNKQKILLHKASMRIYFNYLLSKNLDITYLEYNKYDLEKELLRKNINNIEIIYLSDYILEKRIRKVTNKLKIILKVYDSPNFLTPISEINKYIKSNNNSYFHLNFYKWQRKRLNVLLNENKDPLGGRWSFDEDNRKRLPKQIMVPSLVNPNYSLEVQSIIKDSIKYVNKSFKDNPGFLNEFNYPLDFDSAKIWFNQFLKERFYNFGLYEDAIDTKSISVFHSVITPFLNIGLITPEYILKEVINFADKYKISIQSLEGFIRQIIGWREFMNIIYYKKGASLRNSNFFNHANLLNNNFYEGNTGIAPIDNLIIQLNNTGYSHHITRLMILGNFFLLTEINPNETYKWFMEMYIDSYDWVMVPNVYGMSQFADGGSMVTKPYFSSSNYIKKMSNYLGTEDPPTKLGLDLIAKLEDNLQTKLFWKDIWDGLFWRFLNRNSEILKKNARMGFLVNKIEQNLKKVKIGDEYIKVLFNV